MVGVGIGEYPPENKNILVHKGFLNCTAGKCSPEYQNVGSYSSYQMLRRSYHSEL